MNRLHGKVAFITGGARGQGRATALRFAAEAADIVLTDICADIPTVPYEQSSEDELSKTANEVRELGARCVAVVADVRIQDDLDAAVAQGVAEFGRIDIACANAGITNYAPFWEMSDEAWSDVIDTNLTGVWRTARAVAKEMIKQKSGVILATSSIMGKETGPELAHYTAAKHGVLGLVKSFAYELGPFGIRANAILPSVVHDLMCDNPAVREWIFRRPDATTEEFVEATRHWHALRGRAALPAAAIADAALWLASDEAAHVTGVELAIDDGHLILPGYNTSPVVDEEVTVGPYANDGLTLPQVARR